ncbi:MAG: threonylcarbamoyl-AMP synthase [Clostridia bacterium]|nr:threonylcarbamoyl-AMP synthase [Clostridia bacterium]
MKKTIGCVKIYKIMITKIEPITTESLKLASELIKNGEVVAFPTETVYGLGVSAYDKEGVKKVFLAKGRPSDNPLIVHIADVDDLNQVALEITDNAKKLLNAFAPGPITVVLKKREEIVDEVTAGLDTVGVRIPSHKGAREFIKACGLPIAAPSANTSQRPSPTTALAVYDDMQGKIPLILDGGNCDVGIESSVIDCRFETPIILRAGKITGEDVKRVCGSVKYATEKSEIRSPGMKYRHYAPKCQMFVRFLTLDNLQERIDNLQKQGKTVLLLGNLKAKELKADKFIYLGESVEEYMQSYFSSLREGEEQADVMICYIPFKEKEAEGLYNRALKSSGGEQI